MTHPWPGPSSDEERGRAAYKKGNTYLKRAEQVRKWITRAMWVVVACVAIGLAVKLVLIR